MEWLQRGNTDWIGGLEGITMTQIIASISRLLRCEALLMKRVKLTEAQLFVVDRYMKKKRVEGNKCTESGEIWFSKKEIIQ